MLSAFATGFSGNPLDRADHFRRDSDALAAARMHPAARFLLLDELKPCLTPDRQAIAWARRSDVPDGQAIFLGLDSDGAPRFAAEGRLDDAVAVDARAAALTLAAGDAGIVAQARSLVDWHRRHGFCAACGAATRVVKGGYGRHCDACGAEHFPRVDPVVIMLPEKDGLVLVGRQPRFPALMFSALAGYVEPGETIEEAVARELFEEAGIRVRNVRYVASQPWPFPSTLMIGAMAEAEGFELTLDQEEVAEARWVSRSEVRDALAGAAGWHAPPPLAIAHCLLAEWARA